MQIVVVPLEDGVLLEVDLDIKVARGASVDAVLTLAGKPDAIALINSGGNLHRQGLVLLDAPRPSAGPAGVGNVAPGTVALGAGLLDGEETLL